LPVERARHGPLRSSLGLFFRPFYEGANREGEALISALQTWLASASGAISYNDLGLDPVALQIGRFALRWYSLAYLAGIVLGWWYLMRLIRQPGAPMARRHADDLVFYATLGVILGGRLGYVLFYNPAQYFHHPVSILRVWDGGMSFHGGVIGVSLGIFYMAWRQGLDWLRVHDYVACCVPFGLFLGRLANFVNHELWGAPTHVPWGVIFPGAGDMPRHPSQLYEAALEGILLFLVLWYMFWKTRARYQPGRLVGAFILVYGISRFLVEFIREPDEQLVAFAQATHLHMGQWLSLPMILGGLYLVATAGRRAERVRPVAADDPA
jgi:phosphatidylglycerol:prolipoprotein diacylglycerol transferase